MARTAKKPKQPSNKRIADALARKKISYSYSRSPGSPESTPKSSRSFSQAESLPSSTPKSLPSKQHHSLNSSKFKRRRRSGVVALREIRHLQKTTNLLIPKLPFMRIVQEILQAYSTEPYRLQSQALEILQEMTEMLLVDLFSEAVLCCLHAKRQTIMVPDMRLARRIRGRNDIIN